MEKQIIINEGVSISLERYHELLEKEKELSALKAAYARENTEKTVIAQDCINELNNLLSKKLYRIKTIFHENPDKLDYDKPIKAFASMQWDYMSGSEKITVGVFNVEKERGYTFINRDMVKLKDYGYVYK